MKRVLNTLARYSSSIYNRGNNVYFYNSIDSTWANYYYNVVKQTAYWLDGYCPSFHKIQGNFSTKIASKIIGGLAKAIYGKGIIFKNGNSTSNFDGLNYISHTWCDKTDFKNSVKQLIGYTLGMGTSAMKINKKLDGELWCEPLRLDTFTFEVDNTNHLRKFNVFLNAYTSTSLAKDGSRRNFALYEERYFKQKEEMKLSSDGKYEIKTLVDYPYSVFKIYEIVKQGARNEINFKVVPPEVIKAIRENYGNILFDQEQALPFKEHLGVVLFKYEGGDFATPYGPFGRNIVYENITDFLKYDYSYSLAFRDMYNARGKVGTPKTLTQGMLVGANAQNAPINCDISNKYKGQDLNKNAYDGNYGFTDDDDVEKFVFDGSMSTEGQKPIIVQHEIRATEWNVVKRDILESLAQSIGVTPRTLASYLADGNEKTAEQTHSEDDTMTDWTSQHRDDFLFGLNEIIELVLSYNGYTDNVDVRF